MQILDSAKDQMGTFGVEGITSTQKNDYSRCKNLSFL